MLKQPGPPYGPPANVRAIFRAWRDRGMPAVVTREWLERIGCSPNLATRNVHALRYLRLVDDDAQPTELAERLRVASADAYPAIVGAIVKTAYARIWAVCDPAVAGRRRIEDAFRLEQPAAQRARMVAFFLGLCAEAEILPRAAPDRIANRVTARPAAQAAATVAPVTSLPATGSVAPATSVLLAKFPDFDPAWSDQIKEKWFDAFARLHDELRSRG
jgi:hypothetical protein